MKKRMMIMTAIAAAYLMTCAAGFAQNATQNHGNDGDATNASMLEAHNITMAPVAVMASVAEPTRKVAVKTLPLAPVAKGEVTTAPGLREAQENPYLLLTYKGKDETKTLVNPYPQPPTKIFGPGWNTNIDALRNNPYAPEPAPAFVDLKTLSHIVAKVL